MLEDPVIKRIICFFKGHDFSITYYDTLDRQLLVECARCGKTEVREI